MCVDMLDFVDLLRAEIQRSKDKSWDLVDVEVYLAELYRHDDPVGAYITGWVDAFKKISDLLHPFPDDASTTVTNCMLLDANLKENTNCRR